MKTIQETKNLAIIYGNTKVENKLIACNPCAMDEYEITIKPYGKPEKSIFTFVGLFESIEKVCERVYRQWLNDEKASSHADKD